MNTDTFKVTNGITPYFFNVYVDELSEDLKKCNVGCNIN